MPVFNEVQRKRRGLLAERKRAAHGDPITGKLKQRSQPLSISGKRQRKLFKKWRRDQKEALGKGLITMEDVEMAVAEGTTSTNTSKTPSQFHVKKNKKLKIQQLKKRGKNKSKSDESAAEKTVDAMVE